MISTNRYLVVHRPKPGDKAEYYGPFVNERLANEFTDELPHTPEAFTAVKPLANPHSKAA